MAYTPISHKIKTTDGKVNNINHLVTIKCSARKLLDLTFIQVDVT